MPTKAQLIADNERLTNIIDKMNHTNPVFLRENARHCETGMTLDEYDYALEEEVKKNKFLNATEKENKEYRYRLFCSDTEGNGKCSILNKKISNLQDEVKGLEKQIRIKNKLYWNARDTHTELCDEFDKTSDHLNKSREENRRLTSENKIYKDNDGEGLSEFCELVNKDVAIIDAENIKLTKDLKSMTDEAQHLKRGCNDLLIAYVKNSNTSEEPMYEEPLLLVGMNAPKDPEYRLTIDRMIRQMNRDDWNDDHNKCYFTTQWLEGNSNRGFKIFLNIQEDTSSESESEEEEEEEEDTEEDTSSEEEEEEVEVIIQAIRNLYN